MQVMDDVERRVETVDEDQDRGWDGLDGEGKRSVLVKCAGRRMSVMEMSEELGVSRPLLYYYLKKFDLPYPGESGGGRAAFYSSISRRELFGLYVKQDLSMREIADRYGYGSTAPVRKALAHHSIPPKPSGARRGVIRKEWRARLLAKEGC